MSKLTEKYVQGTSLKFLEDYYKTKNELTSIFAQEEVTTKYKRVRGRADGLIAYKTPEGRIYTVSLEAKSHKTFNSLRTVYENKGFFSAGLLFFVVAFLILHFALANLGGTINYIVSGIISLILTFLILLLLQYNAFFEKHGIIEQVRRYPANERWIAISKDAYNFFNKLDDNELLFRARKYNIGILVVSPGKKIKIVTEAKKENSNKFTDYLKYYTIARKIEEKL